MRAENGWADELDPADATVLGEAFAFVRRNGGEDALGRLLRALDADQRAAVAAHCVPEHVAALVFPPSPERLTAALRASGLRVRGPVPSTVVRDRLALRHRLPADELDVSILHIGLPVGGPDRMEVELFVLPVPPGSPLTRIAERERAEPHEHHLALGVTTGDEAILLGLRALLRERGGLVPDGGGHNPDENCTVLYFRDPGGPTPLEYRRLELRVPGFHPAALAAHPAHAPDRCLRTLLTLLTGAWTTRAIAVAVGLGVPDLLPARADELAGRLAVDPDALARLLRHLESSGVVVSRADGYALTAVGAPLRRTAPVSLAPVALLYGGLFHHSYEALEHSVRTGEEGFSTLFGQGFFGYLAEHPDQAELFDAAMAANAPMFAPVPDLAGLDGVRVVVDIAGGSGELLCRFLGHAPLLRGVLLEQAPVLERARARLAGAGCADRCELIAGDFTRDVPPGGDLYVLSRVLHDWDDERCLVILRHCASRMPPGRRLLIVERLLPVDGRPSLAVTWDLHMLCNLGGRERTGEHYARLLDAAGFDLVSVDELPLDGSLLQAVLRTDGPSADPPRPAGG